MDAARWRRLTDRFEEITSSPEPEARLQLDALRAQDPELADELAAMLAAHRSGRPLALERELAEEGGEWRSARPDTVGPYRLIELLGEGGMAEVWLAERDEPGFRRLVALKRIRAGIATEELRRRFEIEREALARLSHRSIARLLDGGVDEQRVPYLVLDRVEGAPITAAADRLHLTLTERLRLFLEVCDAVSYAHARLVVHRDLKPSNILLTEALEVRLLDFGIAKLLDPMAPGATTRTALRLVTPEYASPEQLDGGVITTATDVYALGLLLFELLAGRRPFRDHEGSVGALERAVRELTAPRPSDTAARDPTATIAASRATTPQALSRALRGDLDTVVATALQKEPARRYASVGELAEDVRRFLRDEPLRARPESSFYRFRKFARRHRAGVSAATLVAVLVVAFAGYAGWQSALLTRERDRARSERDKAREVSDFLVELFGADPYADDESIRDSTPVGEVLGRSELAVRRELAGRPDLQAALLSQLARLQGHLGQLVAARALAAEALDLRRALPGDQRADVAESLNVLATLQQELRELEPAEAGFREALALREAVHGPSHPDVAESVHNLAVLLADKFDDAGSDETERLTRRAVALRTELFGDDHLDTSQSRNALAVFLYRRARPGDLERAEGLYRQVLETRRRRLGPDHPTIANVENNLANLLDDLGREREAVPLFEDAIRVWSRALGAEHPRVATGYYGLAGALTDLGDLAGAETALRRSIEIDGRALPADHPYLRESQERLATLVARRALADSERPR